MAAKTFITLPNGAKMPGLGLGTFDAKSDEVVETLVNAALERGYRHIDTAWIYGNEAAIGKVLKKWFSSGKLKREDLFINTKLPMCGIHPDRVEMFMKKSLKNLQLDYVDLYLVHFPVGCKYEEGKDDLDHKIETEGRTDHAAIWRKMEEQVEAGRTKAIGLSNYNISQIETVLKTARIKPAVLQIEVHVFFNQPELVEFCHKNGIGVVAFSPLASPNYNKFLSTLGLEGKELPNILNNSVVGEIAKKHSKSPAQVALRFLIQRRIVPIPKGDNLQHIKENIDVFDFELSEDEMNKIYALQAGERARVCDFKLFPGLDQHPDFPYPKA